MKGFTLLEILLTIVILSIAGTSLMALFASNVRSSADPLIQQQAIAIAEAYLEEISAMAYSDPDGTEVGEARGSFDDVDDYDGLSDDGVVDQSGTTINALSDYNVSISVAADSLSGVNGQRIDVTVSHDGLSDFSVLLSRYRFDY